MLQVSYIRERTKEVITGLQKRNIPSGEAIILNILDLDSQKRQFQTDIENIQAESNAIAKQVGALMKEGKKEEANQLKNKTTELKSRIKTLEEEFSKIDQELLRVLLTLPNIPHSSVKAGRSAEDNEVIEQHGTAPTLPSGALPHWELIQIYNIIDFELGTKLTGAGFPVYKGQGARLQRALINFFLDEARHAGYTEIQPPILVNQDSVFGTGQYPDKEGQMYLATEDQLYLIPTAEVPITNIYRDAILNETDLPIKNVGHTPCFRREAGSWGSHVRGLNRLHQFDKIEIVQLRTPEDSYHALEEMRKYVQGLLEKLELPYRVLKLCGGDMGFTSALTYDMEVFSAAQERWLEVSSVSNFESFQANRLKLRYKSESKNKLLHTLNGSALALPRIVAAILENNQQKDYITLPKAIHSYTGFDKIERIK